MFKRSIIICVITQFLINYPLVFCEEDDSLQQEKNANTEIDSDSINYDQSDDKMDEHDSEETENFIDPHSLYYDRTSKKVIEDAQILPVKRDKEPSQGLVSILRKNNEDCDTMRVYYKRLILMLLSNADLKVENDLVEGQLFIKGTRNQIEKLRRLENENYSIKEIDLILSEIILKSSYYNYFFHVPDFSEIIQCSVNFLSYYGEAIIVACSVLAIIILSRIISAFRTLLIILIILFTVSFYMTWSHLVKEAEIKLAVAQVKYIEMPVACQPHNMNTWDKLKSFFVDDKECEKYHEARMINPKLQITPAFVLSHLLATVTMHPISHAGEVVSKFINNATAHLYWLRGPAQIILYLSIPAFLMIFVFSLRGGSVKLWLGPLFKFSFSTHGNTSLPDAHKRQTIELIREVLAEVPSNTLPSITETNESVPLSITNNKREDEGCTDNICEDQFTKLTPNESQRELSCASGDSVQNDLLLEGSQDRIKECDEFNAKKHIGCGDAS